MELETMTKTAFLLLLCFGIQAQAPHRFGAIDGLTIPDVDLNIPRETAVARYAREHPQQPQPSPSEAEIKTMQDRLTCTRLHTTVQEAARSRAKSELGIFASGAEAEAARQKLVASAPDPEGMKVRYRERLQALIVGLTAVYDQGRDPQQVYQQLVAPHAVDPSDWAYNLYLGRSKEARQKLAQQLAAATPEGFNKAAANYDARPMVENEKLHAAVDAQLASSDPKFSFVRENCG